MVRFTRRRFLAAGSTVAGSLLLGGRTEWAQSPKQSGNERPGNALKLWYTRPAAQWVDALPIGNGRLGAMVYGGGAVDPTDVKDATAEEGAGPVETDPARETLQLNEDTLWSGMPVDGNNLDAKKFLPAVRRAVLEQ